jgi:hypothetical protein
LKQYVVITDDQDYLDCLGIFRYKARAIECATNYLSERYSEQIPTKYYLGCLENTTNERAQMIHVYQKDGSIFETVFITECIKQEN